MTAILSLAPSDKVDFADSKGNDATMVDGQRINVSRVAPPNYAVLRAGSTQPETLRANTDEEAASIIQRQVRNGQTQIVYLYKLLSAEAFIASSETLTPEQIKERFTNV